MSPPGDQGWGRGCGEPGPQPGERRGQVGDAAPRRKRPVRGDADFPRLEGNERVCSKVGQLIASPLRGMNHPGEERAVHDSHSRKANCDLGLGPRGESHGVLHMTGFSFHLRVLCGPGFKFSGLLLAE